jgi:membrane-associated phospholipid phosphatase
MSGNTYAGNAQHLLLDAASAGFVGSLVVTAILSQGAVPEWKETAGRLVAAGGCYLLVSNLTRRFTKGVVRVAVTSASTLLLYSFLFQAIAGFQHVLVPGWMDSRLIAWETALTGSESTLLFQKITTPILTEWMMFAYVVYVPLLPLIVILCFAGGGEKGAYDFILHFALVNIICNWGFMLFPVAGPLFYDATQYTVPLHGGLFTWCGEWMRSNVHYPGGSLPSPHCADATVMIVMLYRYNRKAFAVLIVPLASIYASTVYGRFHYSWDVAAGIAAGIAALKASPALERLSERAASTLRGLLTTGQATGAAAGALQEERP